MYTLIRKRDNRTFIYNKYQNIRFKMDGNSLTDFPPEEGCACIVFDFMPVYWQTTIIKSIEKINENEYVFITENSEYTITKSD